MSKRMDVTVFGCEVMAAVQQTLAGEEAAQRLRQLFGYRAREIIEALRTPPLLCVVCAKPAADAVSFERPTCVECQTRQRVQNEQEAIQTEAKRLAKEMAIAGEFDALKGGRHE